MARLLCRALGDGHLAGLRELSGSEADVLLRLADHHGLLGALLGAAADTEPPPTWFRHGDADGRLAEIRLVSRQLRAMTVELLQALGRAGVEALPLKGPFLAERLWSDPSLRQSGDIDILVPGSSFVEALATARTLGYQEMRSAKQIAVHHQTLVRPGAPRLELHWQPFGSLEPGPDCEELWSRSKLVPSLGTLAVRRFSPEDELIYLAVHAARHVLERLSWTFDLFLFVDRHPNLDWGAIDRRALRWHVAPAVLVALRHAQRRFGGARPRLPRCEGSSRRKAHVADLCATARGPDPGPHRFLDGFLYITFRALIRPTIKASLKEWIRRFAIGSSARFAVASAALRRPAGWSRKG